MGVKYKKQPLNSLLLEEYTDLLCELIPLLVLICNTKVIEFLTGIY